MKRVSLSRGVFLFPSLCTTAGLFCGFFSIVRSLAGDTFLAFWGIFFAGLFDLIDGRIARMTRTQSEFGMEYDSLSDIVSFGIAPALLVYTWALHDFHRIGWLVSFAFVACGALRLARFNVRFSIVEKKRFQGLPIPMAAGVIASFVLFSEAVFGEVGRNWAALFLTLAVSPLMVSRIRYRSFKELEFRGPRAFYTLLAAVALIVLVGLDIRVMPFVIAAAYALSGPVEEVFSRLLQRQVQPVRRVTRRPLSVIRREEETGDRSR